METGTHHSERTRARLAEATYLAYKQGKLKIKKYQFKKGNVPWNKGFKGFSPSPETCFKEGELVGPAHPFWKGGVRHPIADCVILWAGCNKSQRRPRLIYEKHHGKFPKGYIIYHADGDKDNDDPENLYAISRAELLQLNRLKKRRL